jgi:hypothetical protein
MEVQFLLELYLKLFAMAQAIPPVHADASNFSSLLLDV